jgi:hypothetical protein
MATRKACLSEEWFMQDGLKTLDGLCLNCRAALLDELSVFDANPATALSEVFRLSRAIRVKRVLMGQASSARGTDDWEALRVMRLIRSMIGIASDQFEEQGILRKAA